MLKDFLKNFTKMICICVLIALAIEILVFNYTFWRTLIVGNHNSVEKYSFDEENSLYTIENINFRVTNVKFNYSNILDDNVTYHITFKNDETSKMQEIKSKVLLKDDVQLLTFDTRGNCERLEIQINTNSNKEVSSIELNSVYMNFKFTRFILITAIVILIYKIKKGILDKDLFFEKYKMHNKLFIGNILIVFFITSYYISNQYGFSLNIIKPEEFSQSDSVIQQAEAFMHGQLRLLIEPSDELKNMDNPYDDYKRTTDEINYLYDVAYYNGGYYNYFGVAPIITLILPLRIIIGGYFDTLFYNLIFILGIMIELYLLLKKIANKYYKEISVAEFYLIYFAVLLGSNVLTLLRGAKYDIVVASGIMFLLISINITLKLIENENHKIGKYIILGLSTGLMVLSKPTFIVYYILIGYLLYIKEKGKKIQEVIKDLIPMIIPLSILAIFQMILNYLRFDNILEFGAKYQLTGANMTACMNPTFGKIIAAVGEYIFRIPHIDPFNFPFVYINTTTSFSTLNELLYENRLYGLIAIPLLWIIIFMKDIISKQIEIEKDKKEKLNIKVINKIMIIAIICSWLAIILGTFAGGICEVYVLDAKMVLCICSALLLIMYRANNSKVSKKILIIICITTILLMLPISYTTECEFLTNLTRPITVYLKNFFEFWT